MIVHNIKQPADNNRFNLQSSLVWFAPDKILAKTTQVRLQVKLMLKLLTMDQDNDIRGLK